LHKPPTGGHRTNTDREQFALTHDAALLDRIDRLVTQHEGDEPD
jgi:hypothetical protein